VNSSCLGKRFEKLLGAWNARPNGLTDIAKTLGIGRTSVATSDEDPWPTPRMGKLLQSAFARTADLCYADPPVHTGSGAFRTRIYPRRDDGTEFLLGPRSGPAARAGMPCPAHEIIVCHVLLQ
jgi:hypothetical protein